MQRVGGCCWRAPPKGAPRGVGHAAGSDFALYRGIVPHWQPCATHNCSRVTSKGQQLRLRTAQELPIGSCNVQKLAQVCIAARRAKRTRVDVAVRLVRLVCLGHPAAAMALKWPSWHTGYRAYSRRVCPEAIACSQRSPRTSFTSSLRVPDTPEASSSYGSLYRYSLAAENSLRVEMGQGGKTGRR